MEPTLNANQEKSLKCLFIDPPGTYTDDEGKYTCSAHCAEGHIPDCLVMRGGTFGTGGCEDFTK